MDSSSSGADKARRDSGSCGGSDDPLDIPGKGAPVERLKKWRVSTSSVLYFAFLMRASFGEFSVVFGSAPSCFGKRVFLPRGNPSLVRRSCGARGDQRRHPQAPTSPPLPAPAAVAGGLRPARGGGEAPCRLRSPCFPSLARASPLGKARSARWRFVVPALGGLRPALSAPSTPGWGRRGGVRGRGRRSGGRSGGPSGMAGAVARDCRCGLPLVAPLLACADLQQFLVFFRRSFYRDGIQDGGGVAPAWQLERPAACLRPVSSGRRVRLVSFGRRSGGSGRRAHGRLSGKPRGGGVGCAPWPCGRQGWQRWESLARSCMGAVPRPDPELEALLQSWCPFPSRWGWS
ncbi:hypothetical protein ACQ4PT_065295 [Festuca glaucescens]